jgi:hypothetical protein
MTEAVIVATARTPIGKAFVLGCGYPEGGGHALLEGNRRGGIRGGDDVRGARHGRGRPV